VVQWIGLAVAILAAYFAWRAVDKADDANKIATKALGISEREEKARAADRNSRARLAVSLGIMVYEPGADGIVRLGGSSGYLRLRIVIGNDGDRDAGRGRVEATFPITVNDSGLRWSDAGGRPLSAHPESAARVGNENVLDRAIDGASRGMTETLYVTFPVDVPGGDGVNDYPIRVRVAAEGAEPPEVVEDLPLRIGRDPAL
jgi:hypothetical protein